MYRLPIMLIVSILVLSCIVTASRISPADKIVHGTTPFPFYTDLSGKDKWFELTSEDEMVESWADDEDFSLYRSLSRIGPFSYQHDFHAYLVGLSSPSDDERISISENEIRSMIDSTNYQSSRHFPLTYSNQVVQNIKYTIHRSDADLHKRISDHLQKELQKQYNTIFATKTGSGLNSDRSQQPIRVHDIIFRISPQPIEAILMEYLHTLQSKLADTDDAAGRSIPRVLKRPSIFVIAPIRPVIRDIAGNNISVKYIYTHLPTASSPNAQFTPSQQSEAQRFLSYKPNPRCDFKQYTSSKSPIVFIDLVAEHLEFHGIAMKDIPITQIKPPSIFYAQQQAHHRFALPLTIPSTHSPTESGTTTLSEHAKEHIKTQFVAQVTGLIQHTAENVFLGKYISTAPLLAPKTLVKVYYISISPNSSQVTRSIQNIANQIQHLSPDGYGIDVHHTPVPLMQCPLCVNSINNSFRKDGHNRYLDSTLLFDLFEHFDLKVWSRHSVGKTITFAHRHDYNHLHTMPYYSRTINVFVIDPPEQYESIILLDRLYQSVANNDKTMVISLLTPLAPTLDCPNTESPPVSMTMLVQSPSGGDQTRSLHSNRYHIPITHQSLLATCISVIFGYGSSRSIAFPGGPPIVDSLYVLDGTHPPYSRPLVAASVKYNIEMLLVNQLAADVINAANGVRLLLMRYNIDIAQLDDITVSNIIVRSNMLEYKVDQARSALHKQKHELSVGYLHSARHDLKWLIELFINVINNLEPVTICAHDVAKKTKITGLYDLFAAYLGEDDEQIYGGGARFTNHESAAYKQHLRRIEDKKRGNAGVDHDIKEYIKSQNQVGILFFVTEIFLILFILTTCGICIVMGRKRRQLVVDYGNQLLSGDFSNPFTYDNSSSKYDRHRRNTSSVSTSIKNVFSKIRSLFKRSSSSPAKYSRLDTSPSPHDSTSLSPHSSIAQSYMDTNPNPNPNAGGYYDF